MLYTLNARPANSGVKCYRAKGIGMKNFIIVFVLFWLAVPSGFTQNSAKAEFKLRGKGRQLILKYQGREHKFDVSKQLDAAKLTDVSLLFASRRRLDNYLVIDACGPSKLQSDDRQCGAGTECNLLWIKVNPKWQIEDLKSVRYESCWMPITSSEGYQISGSDLELEYEDLRQNFNYRITYSSEEPERGFQIKERALEDVP